MTDVATTPEQRVPELRHSGVRLTMELLLDRRPTAALRVLLASVEQQARLEGIRADLGSET